MHGIELKTLSIESLAALRDDVIALLAEKAGAERWRLEGEIARIAALAANSAAVPKPKRLVKYRKASNDPSYPNEWSGVGSQPKWVKDHLAAGGILEDLRVT